MTVEQLFERARVTSREVADRTGLDLRRVEAIFWGRWLASPKERQAIADALQVPVQEIEWGHTISPRNVRYHRFGLPEDFGDRS